MMTKFGDLIKEAVGGHFSPKSLFLSIKKGIKRLLELLTVFNYGIRSLSCQSYDHRGAIK